MLVYFCEKFVMETSFMLTEYVLRLLSADAASFHFLLIMDAIIACFVQCLTVLQQDFSKG